MMEVIRDMIDARHIPSFCTGCYRLGRVGKDFMELAKPGLIKSYCLPNAIFTFAEYIHDFGDEDIKNRGLALIDEMIANEILPEKKQAVLDTLKNIKNGKRDLYF
jgi:2-iminoacetate synthase